MYLWKNPTVTAKPPTDLPLSRYFPSIGYILYRSGWTGSDYVFLFKSGTSLGHAHADQNSWSLFGPVTGGVISGNPGYLANTNYDNTANSNSILSKGKPQAQEPGDESSAPLGTKGVIENVNLATDYIYTRGDAHGPYLNLNNSSYNKSSGDFTKFIRHIVLIKDPFYWVIFDQLAAHSSEQMDWLFQGNGGTFATNGNTITLNHGINLNSVILEPASFTSQLFSDTSIAMYSQMRVHPSADTNATNFLTAVFPETTLGTTKIKQGNLLGAMVNIDATHKDLFLYSSDGQPVNQWIELGGQYVGNDGQSYTFNGTQIQASFSTYKVMRLVASVNKPTPVFSDLSAPSIVYGTTPTSLGGTLKSGSLIPTGSVSITLNGVIQTAAINGSGNFASSFATASLGTSGSPYTISYVYGGDTNFNTISDTTNTLTVNGIAARVTLGNLNQTYNGTAKNVTATTNPTGLSVSITYNGSATAPTNAGSYNIVATITSPNYSGSATGTLTIAKATPVFSNLRAPSIVYGTTPTSLGGTLKSGSLIPTGNVSITLNGVTQTAAIDGPGNFTCSFATGSLGVSGSPYAISYVYAGDTNFHNASDNTKTLIVIQTYSAWDVNMDGSVNVLDMITVSQHFGESGSAGWISQDVNSDGLISVLDFVLIGQHWTG
jgi:hypothetical protein